MKFYGRGVVWDAENNKALCRFVNGEIETSDERVMNKLFKLGYEHNFEDPCEECEIGTASQRCQTCGLPTVSSSSSGPGPVGPKGPGIRLVDNSGSLISSVDDPGLCTEPTPYKTGPTIADMKAKELLAILDDRHIPYTSTDKRSKSRLIALLNGGAKNVDPA
jgi:hypothetical protein